MSKGEMLEGVCVCGGGGGRSGAGGKVANNDTTRIPTETRRWSTLKERGENKC